MIEYNCGGTIRPQSFSAFDLLRIGHIRIGLRQK
jgi:hypothetical protein